MRPRAAVAVTAALVAAGTLSGSAVAWERPVTLAPPAGFTDGPQIASGNDGSAVLAWTRGVPTSEELGVPEESRVEATVRGATDAAWSRPQVLSPPDRAAFFATPVIGPSGPVVEWSAAHRGETGLFRGEARRVGGVWTALDVDAEGDLIPLPTVSAQDGVLATAGIIPTSYQGGRLHVTARSAEGVWSEPPTLPVAELSAGAVALLSDGRILVAVTETADDEGSRVATRAWDQGRGRWGPVTRSAELGGPSYDIRLVPLPDGSALAVVPVQGARPSLVAATVSADGPPGAFRAIGVPDGGFDVEAGPGGSATVAWDAADGIRFRTRTASGAWASASRVPGPPCTAGGEELAAVAPGPSGEVLVVSASGWADADGIDGRPKAYVRRPDGTWLRPVWLSPAFVTGITARVGVTGRLIVAWSGSAFRGPPRLGTQVTTAETSTAGTPGVPQPTVGRVSALRLLGGTPPRAIRFRSAYPGVVWVSLEALSGPGGREPPSRRARVRRGSNTVTLPAGTAELGPGRWRVKVEPGPLGCAAASREFVIRKADR